MPGEDLPSALDAATSFARDGLGSVLTELGEQVRSPAEAAAVRDRYLEALAQIHLRSLPAHISVKLTHLGIDTDRDACAAHVQAIARRAAALGTFVWIDMEESRYVDATIAVYRDVRAEAARVGICLQAYLRRTPADLGSLLPLAPSIRLVKGAYREPPDVAYTTKDQVDAQYLSLAGQLLASAREGSGTLPVFGTHDLGLVKRISRRADELGVAQRQYEIHMLYGIRTADQRALAASGHVVRVLISYGTAWFAWYMRRLAERPANLWFVVRSIF